MGIYGAYNFDKCGDFKRIENHFKIFKKLLPHPNLAVERQAYTVSVQIANNLNTIQDITTDAMSASHTFTPNVIDSLTNRSTSKIQKVKQYDMRNKLAEAKLVDKSSTRRMQVWRRSLTHIFELKTFKHFVFGSGRITEHNLSYPLRHAHNQFLSWVISTGLVGFAIALIMFAPLIFRLFTDFPVFIFMSACFLCFITDSPLWIRDTTSQFLIMLLFVLTFIKKQSTR